MGNWSWDPSKRPHISLGKVGTESRAPLTDWPQCSRDKHKDALQHYKGENMKYREKEAAAAGGPSCVCVCWDWPPWGSPEHCTEPFGADTLQINPEGQHVGFALLCTCLKLTVVQGGMAEQPKLPLAPISPGDHVRTWIHLFVTQLEKKLKHLHSSLLQ